MQPKQQLFTIRDTWDTTALTIRIAEGRDDLHFAALAPNGQIAQTYIIDRDHFFGRVDAMRTPYISDATREKTRTWLISLTAAELASQIRDAQKHSTLIPSAMTTTKETQDHATILGIAAEVKARVTERYRIDLTNWGWKE